MPVRPENRLLWYALPVLLAQAGISLGALAAQRGQDSKLASPAVAPTQLLSEEEQEARIPRITLDEARQKLGSPAVVFVDTRGGHDYQTARIRGAWSLPVTEIDQRAGDLPRDKHLILYCA